MFRFLLEAYENMALFSVLDKNKAAIKLIFAPSSKLAIKKILDEINESVNIQYNEWPF